MLLSESIVSKLLEIERANTLISASGISNKRFNKYVQDATIDTLFSLGRTIFPKITRLDAKRLSKAKDLPDYLLLTNLRKTLEYIRYQSEFSPITANIANHINKLICDNIVENWQPRALNSKGRFENTYDFTGIRPEESENIENIIMLVNKTSLPILKASELFQYIVKFKPFIALNDITALAICIYECSRFYSKNANILSISRIFLSEDKLDDIIESNDVLNILVSGIYTDILDLKERILRHSYQDKVDRNSQYSDLSERQLAVLRYLQNNPTINRRQYMKLFKVSTMTAFRDLNDLVDKKIIRVKGVGRGTYYEIEKS
ncbi:MAG: DeoR family transcriptional regulator [bacterium]